MSAEQLIADLDALYSKYKMMENSLMQKTQRFSGQVVEIKSTLGILRHIAKTDDADAGATALETDFRLGDALFVKAKVPKTDKVCLWLGVSVGRRRFGCFAVAFLTLRTNRCRCHSSVGSLVLELHPPPPATARLGSPLCTRAVGCVDHRRT